jgi:hypothetical protein
MSTHVTISEQARTRAENRAKTLGFRSMGDDIEALIRGDQDEAIFKEWMRVEVEEGFASGPPTEFARSKLQPWVREGMEDAKKDE